MFDAYREPNLSDAVESVDGNSDIADIDQATLVTGGLVDLLLVLVFATMGVADQAVDRRANGNDCEILVTCSII